MHRGMTDRTQDLLRPDAHDLLFGPDSAAGRIERSLKLAMPDMETARRQLEAVTKPLAHDNVAKLKTALERLNPLQSANEMLKGKMSEALSISQPLREAFDRNSEISRSISEQMRGLVAADSVAARMRLSETSQISEHMRKLAANDAFASVARGGIADGFADAALKAGLDATSAARISETWRELHDPLVSGGFSGAAPDTINDCLRRERTVPDIRIPEIPFHHLDIRNPIEETNERLDRLVETVENLATISQRQAELTQSLTNTSNLALQETAKSSKATVLALRVAVAAMLISLLCGVASIVDNHFLAASNDAQAQAAHQTQMMIVDLQREQLARLDALERAVSGLALSTERLASSQSAQSKDQAQLVTTLREIAARLSNSVPNGSKEDSQQPR